MGQGLAHRGAGGFDDAVERMVHFVDQEDGDGEREGAEHQGDKDGFMGRREQADAHEEHGEPGDERDVEDVGQRGARLLDGEAAGEEQLVTERSSLNEQGAVGFVDLCDRSPVRAQTALSQLALACLESPAPA